MLLGNGHRGGSEGRGRVSCGDRRVPRAKGVLKGAFASTGAEEFEGMEVQMSGCYDM